MTQYSTLLVELRNHTALIKVNRPKALNALNREVLCDLHTAFKDLALNPDVLGVIVTGEGDKAFVAGADIPSMQEMTVLHAKHFVDFGHSVMDAIERFPRPVIAAVNGFALGGGLELALACDFIYASETAKLGLPELNLGIFPGFGGTQRLSRAIGLAKAKELIFTARMLNAVEAKAWGIVNEVFKPEELLGACEKVLQGIYTKGPVAVSIVKEVMNAGANRTLESGLALERNSFPTVFSTDDKKEGMSAFLAKRPAQFKGK